jgi:hypothetical protein
MKPLDKTDPAWRNLKLWLGTQIQALRRDLENPDPAIPEATHQANRGRIAAYTKLIREVEPEKLAEREEARSFLGAGEDFNYQL